jgi:hypothetical protein
MYIATPNKKGATKVADNAWIKRLRQPLGTALMFTASLGISIAYNTYTEHKARIPKHSDLQLKLDEVARRHASEDELPGFLIRQRKISLNGSSLLGVSRLRVAPGGGLIVLDTVGRKIERFSSNGERLGPAGSGENGTQPGDFMFPSGVDVGAAGMMVADFKQTRISRLSPQGTFQDSFSTSAERFSAKSVFAAPHQSDIYVCGNRYMADLATIHRYSSTGVFEGSLLPLPKWARPLNLEAFNDCLSSTTPQHTLVAFPYEYQVFDLSGGTAKPLEIEAPAAFHRPAKPLVFAGVDPAKHLAVFEEWKAEWTPIEAIALVNHDRLLIEYQTYSPLRYTLDVWDLGQQRRVRTLHTNYRLMTAGNDNRPYFLADGQKENRYELLSGALL